MISRPRLITWYRLTSLGLHGCRESRSHWKPPKANAEVSPIKTQVAIAVKWPSNTHKPSFSIIPTASSTTAQAGMLFEKGMGNGNINPTPAITIPKPINRNIPGPACRKDKRGRTNFSSWRATLVAPTRSWSDRVLESRRFIMKRGSQGSRPTTRQAPIKLIAIPKGIDRPGIATKQNGNANSISNMAEPRPSRACFNSASVSVLSFTRACSVAKSVDKCERERSVVMVK
jgi:hypothetical protein